MKTLSASAIPLFLLIITSFSFKGKNYGKMNSPLIGTYWNVVGLNGQQVATNTTSKPMYLEFKADSTVSGNGGCNAFSGNYSVGKDNEISFGQMVRTNVLCAGIDYEKNYVNSLAKADHYAINRDTLTLKNELVNLAKFVGGK